MLRLTSAHRFSIGLMSGLWTGQERKHSPSRMHWGCFSRQGVRPIVPLHGQVTGSTHVEILRKYAMPTMRRMFPRGDGWLQEDNARPHKSQVAAAFHEES